MELIVALVFLSAVTLVLAAAPMARPRGIKKRLARLGDGSRAVLEEETGSGLLAPQKEAPWTRLLGVLGRPLTQSEDSPSIGRTRQRLREAGYRKGSALTVFQGSRMLMAATLPVVALVFSRTTELSHSQVVLLVCLSGCVGLVAPSYWIDRRRAARKLEILLGLPDALDLMVVCVEAGLGVNASLTRVAREFRTSSRTLAAEFELVTLEVRAGKSTTQALRALAERTGVSEVGSLVAMLVQTERFGTSVADTLRVFADSMRSQRMLRAEEQAGKAPLKMLFPTVIIFIATMIMALGPGLIQMFAFFAENQK